MRVAEKRHGGVAHDARLNLLLLAVLDRAARSRSSPRSTRRASSTSSSRRSRSSRKQLEVEWGQLQLEQSTWAMHARIEKIAARDARHARAGRRPRRRSSRPARRGAGRERSRASPALALKFPAWRSRLLLVALLGVVRRARRARALPAGAAQRLPAGRRASRATRACSSCRATRGMIVDRNGEPLAISTPVESVAASPATCEVTRRAARAARAPARHGRRRAAPQARRHEARVRLPQAPAPARAGREGRRAGIPGCSCSASTAATTRPAK